jgi:hypothetical protein
VFVVEVSVAALFIPSDTLSRPTGGAGITQEVETFVIFVDRFMLALTLQSTASTGTCSNNGARRKRISDTAT